MSKQIRVAILGQGRSGRDIHGAHLSTNDSYRIVAVSDVDESRRNRAVSEYGCEVVADYSSLFGREDIDLVVNALPSQLHVSVTLEFLKQGMSVLCEKPIAPTAKDLDMMVMTAKANGAGLYFFQNSRFVQWFTIVREVLASGVLGRVAQYKLRYNAFGRRWDWQTLQSMTAGSLRNTGPHPMDMAVVLMNSSALPEVFCHFDRVNTWGDAEDFVKVLMRVPNGPLVDLEIISCDRFPGPILSIQAQNGSLRADANSVTWHYFDPNTAPAQKLVRAPLQNPDGTPAYCREQLTWIEKTIDTNEGTPAIGAPPPGGPTELFYNKLHAHITTGAAFEITAAQVRQQIAIMEECHRQSPQTRME